MQDTHKFVRIQLFSLTILYNIDLILKSSWWNIDYYVKYNMLYVRQNPQGKMSSMETWDNRKEKKEKKNEALKLEWAHTRGRIGLVGRSLGAGSTTDT